MPPPRTSKRLRPPNFHTSLPSTHSLPAPASHPSTHRGRPRVRTHFALGLPVDNSSAWDSLHHVVPKKHVHGPRVSMNAVLSLAALVFFVFALWRGGPASERVGGLSEVVPAESVIDGRFERQGKREGLVGVDSGGLVMADGHGGGGPDGDKIRDEGVKLQEEGTKVQDEGTKVQDEGTKVQDAGLKQKAEGGKQQDEGVKLRDEGEKMKDRGLKLQDEGVVGREMGVGGGAGGNGVGTGGGLEGKVVSAAVDVGAEDGMLRDDWEEEKKVAEMKAAERLGFERSWPVSEKEDLNQLMAVERHLGFTNETLVNYFHMHKTGGVTTKVSVMVLMNSRENRELLTKRGERMTVNETCYQTEKRKEGDKSIEAMWRCDWAAILNMTERERDGVDIVLGHQYWVDGCDKIFGAKRKVRHFSIFRHPLPRKLSFFYHFFIRNLGRDEQDVSKEEVIRFLLGEDLPDNPRSRDAGPNYYASRLLSDGTAGFVRHQFKIAKEDQDEAIKRALSRLDERFAFMGLQMQPEASQCMLKKTVEVLAHAHGIDELKGTSTLVEGRSRLNVGTYPWTARKIWEAMSEEQKSRFQEVEKVDLAIYRRAVEMFKRDVVAFNCGHKVREEVWAEDQF